MLSVDKRRSRGGFYVGDAGLGIDLQSALNSIKPGEVRIIGRIKKVLIRYRYDGTITIVNLSDGKKLFEG
jgi:hypothetical protein